MLHQHVCHTNPQYELQPLTDFTHILFRLRYKLKIHVCVIPSKLIHLLLVNFITIRSFNSSSPIAPQIKSLSCKSLNYHTHLAVTWLTHFTFCQQESFFYLYSELNFWIFGPLCCAVCCTSCPGRFDSIWLKTLPPIYLCNSLGRCSYNGLHYFLVRRLMVVIQGKKIP